MLVFILDGNVKSALAATRSAAKAGFRVVAAAERPSAMALHSKYATDTFVYPSPVSNQESFIDSLIEAAKNQTERPALMCFSDATYLSVARHKDRLVEYFRLVLPEIQNIETAFSKDQTYELARQLHIPTIREYALNEVSSFPTVVKPGHSVSWSGWNPQSRSIEVAFSKSELDKVYDKMKVETGELPIIQEFIVGKEYGVELMCKEGNVLQEFTHERVRSLSPRGGAATVKRKAPVSKETKEMRRHAQQLVEELSWTGPIMVEFKLSNYDSSVRLMEINGRFWGSLPLPIAAGVDFVKGYLNLLNQDQISEIKNVVPLQTQHFLGDCRWLVRVMFNNDPLRPVLYPSRLEAVVSFIESTLFDRGDVWSLADPKPFIMEYIDVIKQKI